MALVGEARISPTQAEVMMMMEEMAAQPLVRDAAREAAIQEAVERAASVSCSFGARPLCRVGRRLFSPTIEGQGTAGRHAQPRTPGQFRRSLATASS